MHDTLARRLDGHRVSQPSQPGGVEVAAPAQPVHRQKPRRKPVSQRTSNTMPNALLCARVKHVFGGQTDQMTVLVCTIGIARVQDHAPQPRLP